MKRTWIAAAALTACLSSVTDAEAASWKDRQNAQKLGKEAKALAVKGDFEEAAAKYREADELVPAPSYKLELARMLAAMKDLIGASEVLAACVETEPRQWVEKVAYKNCQAFITEVADRTPTIEVTVFEPSADEVTVTVDGESYEPGEGPVGYNPGKVKIVAEAAGYEPFEKTVKLMEGEKEAIEITMTKAKGGADEGEQEEEADGEGISPVWAYATWGVGAVGLGLGIGFGVSAIQSTNEVIRAYECQDSVCPPEAADDLATAKLNGNVSTAGFVIGFAGITAGTILFLLSSAMDDDESDAVDEEAGLGIEARPMLGPGFVGVSGSF